MESRDSSRPNFERPEYDEPREHNGFRAQRARIGYALGSERLGISQWHLPPGEAAYPYHWHVTEEELRTPLPKPVMGAGFRYRC